MIAQLQSVRSVNHSPRQFAGYSNFGASGSAVFSFFQTSGRNGSSSAGGMWPAGSRGNWPSLAKTLER